MRNLTAKELKAYLEETDPPPLLLDVREPWEHQRVHLPDSKLIPMRQIPYSMVDLDPRCEIVVYCHHGIRSRQVAFFLEQHGFDRVINLHGGIDAWARDVDRTIPVY